MLRNRFQICLFIFATVGLVVYLSSMDAVAVPSFMRQTGMSCTTCHTVWPELTPFGRVFKMQGYTFSTASSKEKWTPPLSAMFKASVTELNKNNGVLNNGVAPFDNSEDSATDKVNIPQEAALYYAGKIIDHMGAFTHVMMLCMTVWKMISPWI